MAGRKKYAPYKASSQLQISRLAITPFRLSIALVVIFAMANHYDKDGAHLLISPLAGAAISAMTYKLLLILSALMFTSVGLTIALNSLAEKIVKSWSRAR
ncbi:MAG: hypothetical protein ACI85S_002370 [Pseudohongiellaceae bacterium]|jgi:hypothetical protein